MPAEDLLMVRANDDAIYAFRREMTLIEPAIHAYPGEPEFEQEVQEIFATTLKPSLRRVEAAMAKNSMLRELPYVVASAGFAYAAAAASDSNAEATIFGTLSAIAGFGALFKELTDRETKVRHEPAYVLWKAANTRSS
jgi:hypothetical protein